LFVAVPKSGTRDVLEGSTLFETATTDNVL
jgi:hypothetical protein